MGELIQTIHNHKKLICYKKADVLYQITYYFCHKYLDRKDRTKDQMIQAARSGKQNIIEGLAASSTSMKTGIKLVNVAKASLKELLEDYEDYLHTHKLKQWKEGEIEFDAMRNLGRQNNEPEFFIHLISTRSPETIANMAIVLLNQADYLLYRLLLKLESDFEKNGGFSEKMTSIRKKQRGF